MSHIRYNMVPPQKKPPIPATQAQSYMKAAFQHMHRIASLSTRLQPYNLSLSRPMPSSPLLLHTYL